MCVFCKIVAGEIPSMKVYEDEHTFVFMDIAGDVDGHMLAVPKKHVKNILDCDLDILNHLMVTVKRVSDHCVENCGYQGVNLLNASDESAGQSVPHFHIHIIPRKNDDEVDAWPKFEGAKCEIEEVWKRIKLDENLY
jgi:histidine triad (HIT) family protein